MLLDIFFLFIQFSRCSLSRTVSLLSGFPKISPRQTSQITSERLPRLPSSFFLRAASRCVCKHHACAGGLNTRVTLCLFGLCASRINPAHFRVLVGLSGLEPPTSRLSGVRSNRLSYKPIYQKRLSRLFFSFCSWQPPALPHRLQCSTIGRLRLNHRVRDGYGCGP